MRMGVVLTRVTTCCRTPHLKLTILSIYERFLFCFLPQVALESGVKEIKMCQGGTGLVAMTNSYQFISITNFDKAQHRLFQPVPGW